MPQTFTVNGCTGTKNLEVVMEIGQTGYVDVSVGNSGEYVCPGFADQSGGNHEGDTILGR